MSISHARPPHIIRFVDIAPCVDAKGHARDDDNSDRCKEASSHSRYESAKRLSPMNILHLHARGGGQLERLWRLACSFQAKIENYSWHS